MKILTAAQAASLIEDGWTVVTAGFVGAGHAEAVTSALERRFLAEGAPRGLTLLYAAGQGDRAHRGVNHFGHAGLLRRVIGGHWISAPKLGALVARNEIEAYNWPQGVISHLYRAIAGHKPGVITRIGLHTFVDPRHDGGRLTPRTTEPLVQLIELAGEEQLFYPSLPVHCALIRATTADEHGNLSTEHEPFHQDLLAIAQAAHNSGGIVIAQVKRLARAGSLNPNLVRVPGILVDHVVLTEDPDDHWMTFGEAYNPTYNGELREPEHACAPAPLDARKIVQRRAFLELQKLHGPVVNLGVGMPAGIGHIAREEGHRDFTLTVEAGPIGGTPAQLLSFGASANPEAIIDHAAMFDFYDGGGIDIAFLGMAELDPEGNVNVSRFGDKIAGVGGFINITQTARRVVLMGSLTAGGLEVRAVDGRLRIVSEGRVKKVVPRVGHLSFNGPYVSGLGREVLYVTERAVFVLRDGRLTLTEVAPGIDLEREVLAQCAAPVDVASDLKTMDERIFREAAMNRGALSMRG
ncbi:acyl CoA:acetate/3-ketoacid CoA transferase [Aquabacterium sp. A7-Y]|uniref:acyl CoA:acetate/3-ketoacid CoA transferase n=1 Tax=Aquabacterium sp. A7-Y TaxID=1349605 RepID=UPI00223CE38F|nr:acyl CoA:acetate/3-ketoacid CoA transferase [Aquabacterium sp. A7-Y]MCW7537006.1 acyl CoA:acetate/3-ketoacid CoA transferase [Aquabacterium sp. A7-Y]